jgi:hypothetical protein
MAYLGNTSAPISVPQLIVSSAIIENSKAITANYTIQANNNALSAGPITIASGVTVNVPSTSVWTIV